MRHVCGFFLNILVISLSTNHEIHAFSIPTTKTSTTSTKLTSSISDTQQLEDQLSKCKTGTAAQEVIDDVLLTANDNNNAKDPLYNSISIPKGASILSISDAELAIQTNIRNNKYSIMELIELNGDKDADRASLALLTLFIGSSLSAITTQQNLPGPEILRFVVTWIFCFLPLIFVGFGLSIPNELQSVLIQIQANFFPTYKKRMVHHEAGHFLIGHLLGMPIKGYRANAIKNAVEFYPLRDDDVGTRKKSLLGFDGRRNDDSDDDPSFYDYNADNNSSGPGGFFEEGGRGEVDVVKQSVFRDAKKYADNPFLKISSQNDVKQSWPYRGFDHSTIDKLAVVSVAGVSSEILSFGNAEGGFADFGQLRQILINAEPELSDREMESVIRYSIGYTMGQLRRHLGALDALIEIMERDGSVAECIMAIESCENVSGSTIMGNYEKDRRENIQTIGLIEKLALGGKNSETEDDSVIYGKGGGERKKGFQLTGDDPLYAALAIAAFFLAWASAGGLSLH